MKKIYTIEITSCSKKGIWYENKIGKKFDAELRCNAESLKQLQIITFEVNPCQFVHLVDCKVVAERIVEKYARP